MKILALGSSLDGLRISPFTAFLLALSALGSVLILLRETNYGVGLDGDSALYISTARNLLEGNGFVTYSGGVYGNAPPLFPLVLAFAGLLGMDVIVAAGYLNAIAFGVTAFITGIWLMSRIESRFLVTWAVLGCILSLRLIHSATYALTESLFVLFVVASIFALDRFLYARKYSFLILSAVCAALACITRYPGIMLVIATLLLLLGQRHIALDSRIRTSGVYLLIAMAPIGVWMLRNIQNSGSPTGRVGIGDLILTLGFALVAIISVLALLVMQQRQTHQSKIWNAAVFAIVALGVIGFWIGWSLLNSASSSGAGLVEGFSPTPVLHTFTVEFGRWVFGHGGFKLLDLASDALFGIDLSGGATTAGVLLKTAIILLVTSAVIYLLLRLNRSGDLSTKWRIWSVPVGFFVLYTLGLAVTMWIRNDANLPYRYFAPLYVPALVAVTLVLNEFLCYARRWQLLGPFSWLQKYDPDVIQKTKAILPTSILIIVLSLWITQQIYTNYHHIIEGVDNGKGYASREWTDSETVQYLRDNPINGYIWSNDNSALYLLVGIWNRPQGMSYIHARSYPWSAYHIGEDVHLVWFHSQRHMTSYGFEDIANLPGMETMVELEDGVILKIDENFSNNGASDIGPTSGTNSIIQKLLKTDRLIVNSNFDVYPDDDGTGIIYVREACEERDIAPKFFLHIFPDDYVDLPENRRALGFAINDFDSTAFYFLPDGSCVARRVLPDYEIDEIRTGQRIDGLGTLWQANISLEESENMATPDREWLLRTRLPIDLNIQGSPVIDSFFDVYLDESNNRLAYVRRKCVERDIEPLIFLDIFPLHESDLPEHRRQYDYDNLDFRFDDYGSLNEDLCVATIDLPHYDIAGIKTGQYNRSNAMLWSDQSSLFVREDPFQLDEEDLLRAGLGKDDRPMIDSFFNVYLHQNDNKLIYARKECVEKETETKFLLHIFPFDEAHLPEERNERRYISLDFHFDDHGEMDGDLCMASRDLPDYGIAEIRTGQSIAGLGDIWYEKVRLVGAEDTALLDEERLLRAGLDRDAHPLIHSVFDVYLNEQDNRLIYARRECEVRDVGAKFFLHIVPKYISDLPEHRHPSGYDNLDFRFADHGEIDGDLCVASRELPDYGITEIRTGQYVHGLGEFWQDNMLLAEYEDVPTLNEDVLLAVGLGKDAHPVISSFFDVYLDAKSNRLIYARRQCQPTDSDPRFFLHIFPRHGSDIPEHRRQHGYDNFDFQFDDYESSSPGLCVAVRSLPDYEIAELRTGQYVHGLGELWAGGFRIVGAQKAVSLDEDASLRVGMGRDTRPLIRSFFDVYLSKIDNRLIYLRRQCRDVDTEMKFFLHVFPFDQSNLPEEQSYVSLGFHFPDHGALDGDLCVATRELPDYGIAEIRTGQSIDGLGDIWHERIRLVGSDDTTLLDDGRLLRAGLNRDAHPVIHSFFDVYLDDQSNRLIYARRECEPSDSGASFFLHIFPLESADLPADHRVRGYDNLDFRFTDHGTVDGDLCVASRDLPNYRIAEIRTGQFIRGLDELWEGKLSLESS